VDWRGLLREKLLQVKIRGVLQKADHEGFEGWARREDWGDVSFMMEEGQQIAKMAIVADEKWRDDALAFTARGFRPTAIEFFAAPRMNEARTWLAA
jgi:hypothetical protein